MQVMGERYAGLSAERITYTGLLYNISGHVCGEVPDFPDVVANGSSEAEVKATLQGLLEEHIEEMIDEEEPLPEPEFDSVDDVEISPEMYETRTVKFTVVLPSTVSK